jgi:hypothetical protein
MPARLKRSTAGKVLASLLLAGFAAGSMDQDTKAALDITIDVSPAQATVGQPVEVLLRTYLPIRQGDLDLPTPSLEYPVSSGLWDVLYPFPDYPFKIDITSPSGEVSELTLTRDAVDASLWRGSFTPSSPGDWTVALTNTPNLEPTRVSVSAQPGLLMSEPATIVALIATALVGFVLGGALVRRRRVA